MVTKHGKTRFSGLPEEVERILEIFEQGTSVFLFFFTVRLNIKQYTQNNVR